MKVYVATAYANRAEASDVMAALEAEGHTITHDWTGKALDPSWTQERQNAYLQVCGAEDFKGVVDAEAFVLVNHKDLRDGMAEFGVALGKGKFVFVLHPERRPSVFFHRARCTSRINDVLEALEGCL